MDRGLCGPFSQVNFLDIEALVKKFKAKIVKKIFYDSNKKITKILIYHNLKRNYLVLKYYDIVH